ncbi:MAG: hypothetical protein OEZ22_05730 [Spirochaetia bacterium]|nr:hypothetical protein [Spirochaetia bacterium]
MKIEKNIFLKNWNSLEHFQGLLKNLFLNSSDKIVNAFELQRARALIILSLISFIFSISGAITVSLNLALFFQLMSAGFFISFLIGKTKHYKLAGFTYNLTFFLPVFFNINNFQNNSIDYFYWHMAILCAPLLLMIFWASWQTISFVSLFLLILEIIIIHFNSSLSFSLLYIPLIITGFLGIISASYSYSRQNFENYLDKEIDKLKFFINDTKSQLKDRILIEEKLIDNYEKVEKDNYFRGSFLESMSAQFQNKLMPIDHFIHEFKKNKKLPEPIEQSIADFKKYIEDILYIGKIEQQNYNKNLTTFDFNNFVEQIITAYNKGIKNNKIGFLTYISPSIPEKILADKITLQKIINSLLEIITNLTNEGEVFFKIELNEFQVKSDNTDTFNIRLEISNTEQGVLLDIFKSITNTYYSKDSIKNIPNFEKIIFNLILLKKSIEIIGGRFEIKSQHSMGNRIFVYLSLKKAKEIEKKQVSYKSAKILLISENMTERFILSSYLDALGIKHTIKINIDDAFKYLKKEMNKKNSLNGLIINHNQLSLNHLDLINKKYKEKLKVILLLKNSKFKNHSIGTKIIKKPILRSVFLSEIEKLFASN